ncbi:MAG: hypothetical protein ACP5M4_02810 [Acidobacteriaceae bacterium]
MRTAKLILCTLLSPLTLLPIAAQKAPPAAHFPTVTSYNLAKAKVTLPAAFSANRNLLLISFDTGDTPEIDRWVTAVQSLSRLHNSLDYYLLPISEQKNPLYRWWDNSAMRSDFTDPQLWPRVVPLYLNENQFRRQLQIPRKSSVVVLLTDRSGNILWRASGPPDQQKLDALRSQLHS